MTDSNGARVILAVCIQDAADAIGIFTRVLAGAPPDLDDVRVKNAAMVMRRAAWRALYGSLENWDENAAPKGGTGMLWSEAAPKKPEPEHDYTVEGSFIPDLSEVYEVLRVDLKDGYKYCPDCAGVGCETCIETGLIKLEENDGRHEGQDCLMCDGAGWLKTGGRAINAHVRYEVCPACDNPHHAPYPYK